MGDQGVAGARDELIKKINNLPRETMCRVLASISGRLLEDFEGCHSTGDVSLGRKIFQMLEAAGLEYRLRKAFSEHAEGLLPFCEAYLKGESSRLTSLVYFALFVYALRDATP